MKCHIVLDEIYNWDKNVEEVLTIYEKVFDLESSIKSKKSYGGTSFENVKKMIKKYKKGSK